MKSDDGALRGRPPGRPRSAEADEAILAAATELLIERGVGQVSVEQVARRAGVTRATVYRRFPNLTALLVGAVEWEYRDADTGGLEWPDVDAMVAHWAALLAHPRDRKLMRRLYAAADDYPELLRAYADAHGRRGVEAVRATLDRAREAGELPPHVDSAVLQQMFAGAALLYVSVHPDDSGEDAIKGHFTDILRQVGYRPAASREGAHDDE
ncbi:TetR family transcriptional regulator [Saccharopolyspora erythraea NRRL 2338]|uniref:TetR family transcriptional regulatory protein n=2 Tax=Saccharopolyspora erythraea TaxID=1836 RepID=A4FI63_SACEN|nr:TetR/AcrR family transcriptional regulator [Saccharopolyspora erythraea]EQD86210.1 TetR family transcriptional regulator [Saccharopolyspora erythraea D]PFG97419.1 TetR family transcriptional regulator [Saccharopolyspora erythraea NRRL 2338]QRK87598.1 TetR/AcrR family transcriptional regulator [Saccharopolyspora erythraea]CAM03738.1 TetR family transcriptional regulatory protein [Saccharopolyspora erythraea NRRL 2338]